MWAWIAAYDDGVQDRRLVKQSEARVTVDAVTRSDRARVAGMLAEAFRDDELSRWIYQDHRARMRWVKADFRLRLDQHARDGLSYVTGDLSGAAVWAAPGRWRGHPVGQARAFAALWRVARNHKRIHAVQEQLDHRHPKTPHYYLALLGVVADRRSEGLGAALLAPVLQIADRTATPAYVEAGSDRAAEFYARHGFRANGEVRAAGAPVVHLMWREPERP